MTRNQTKPVKSRYCRMCKHRGHGDGACYHRFSNGVVCGCIGTMVLADGDKKKGSKTGAIR